ncbi:MAG TPA: hypothetical protein VFZ02_00745, partial [Ktedonobacteraceae bacterium]
VPVKLPVTRLRRLSDLSSIPIEGFHGCKFAICAAVGTWWFAVLLSARGSKEDLLICEAHVLSPGNALPGGRVAPLFIPGVVGVSVEFLVGVPLGERTTVGVIWWAGTANE